MEVKKYNRFVVKPKPKPKIKPTAKPLHKPKPKPKTKLQAKGLGTKGEAPLSLENKKEIRYYLC